MCKTHLENQETLLRKILKDLGKGENMAYSSTQKFSFIKLSVLPKLSYRFYSTSVKILVLFCGNWKDDSIFFSLWNVKGQE